MSLLWPIPPARTNLEEALGRARSVLDETGTNGVVVRRLDERGLHMPGELRDTADAPTEDTAESA